MKKIKNVDGWRTLKFDQIIDVRSPAEFEIDHIPGSTNIPILNNIEILTMKKVLIISAVTKFGLDFLLSSIWNELGY